MYTIIKLCGPHFYLMKKFDNYFNVVALHCQSFFSWHKASKRLNNWSNRKLLVI